MKTDSQEERIYRYLLDDLPEAEQFALEQDFFADGELFEQVWAMENILIDRYVRDCLTPAEKSLFEKHYLSSPIRSERVTFAQTLIEVADAERARADFGTEPSASLWRSFLASLRQNSGRWVTAAAILLLLVGSIWGVRENLHLHEQMNQLKVQKAAEEQRAQELEKAIADERERSAQLAAELERWREETSRPPKQPAEQTPLNHLEHPSVVSLLLSPMLMRNGSEPPQLQLTKATTQVLLQMKVEEAKSRSFQLSLRTVEGRAVWSQDAVQAYPQGKTGSLVALSIPANKLPTGDYILTLSASNAANVLEEINRYFFRIVKR